MRNLLYWVAAVMIPLALFLQVNQAYDYYRLSSDLRKLRREIAQTSEQNRQLEIGRSILENPERIDRLAREELGLSVIESRRIIKVRLNSGRGP